jgi:NAD(P)-dependent dehydrogenase (short-subunit alcohol dehydrogenase family)
MQNIVITGGGSGLGRAMASEFGKRQHRLILAGRNIETLRSVNGQCLIFPCDVRDHRDVQELGRFAHESFDGHIHHWINNAAVCEGPEDFTQLELQDMENVIITNLLGTAYGIKVAHSIGVDNIYVVNGHGSNGAATPLFSAYGASKAAVNQMCRSLSSEGISIRELKPGIIKTSLSSKMFTSDKLNIVQRIILQALSQDPDDAAKRLVDEVLRQNKNKK